MASFLGILDAVEFKHFMIGMKWIGRWPDMLELKSIFVIFCYVPVSSEVLPQLCYNFW